MLLAFYRVSRLRAERRLFNWTLCPVDREMSSLVVDAGQVALPSPIADTKNQHTYSTLNLEDRMNFTAILVWWRITEQWEWAAAGRFLPVDLRPKGRLTFLQTRISKPRF